MYLINPLSLQIAQTLFITISRYRAAQGLVGPKDGSNETFTTPGLEKFVHNLPFLDISIYYNGVRLALLDDYMVVESGGSGASTGARSSSTATTSEARFLLWAVPMG